jgi:hypothetical protein
MQKVGATLANAALTAIFFVPLFGHRHHHRPLYMHGNTNHVGRHESPSGDVGRHESPSGAQRPLTFALLYPERALPAIFQNVFWPAYSSPWPFG